MASRIHGIPGRLAGPGAGPGQDRARKWLAMASRLYRLTPVGEDYPQWVEGEAGIHGRDLVATGVRQRPAGMRSPVEVAATGGTRGAIARRRQADLDIAREVARATEGRRSGCGCGSGGPVSAGPRRSGGWPG